MDVAHAYQACIKMPGFISQCWWMRGPIVQLKVNKLDKLKGST